MKLKFGTPNFVKFIISLGCLVLVQICHPCRCMVCALSMCMVGYHILSYLRLINHGGQWTLKKLIYKMNGRQNARVYSISWFNLMERVRNPFNKMLHLHKIFTTFVLFFYFILSFLLTSGD